MSSETTIRSDSDRTPVERPVVPDYEPVRLLGRGGFGEVWLARSGSGVFRAVKVVRAGAVSEAEFQGIRVFETFARGHAHLVDIRHVGQADGRFYYVMELADGYSAAPTFSPDDYVPRTLQSDLRRRGRLPLDESLRVIRELLCGLQHLHRNDLLHRDVKPANVIFVGGAAKLADIGLVTREQSPGPRAYTPHYAPTGGVEDRGGDLFCVGRMLYEMVSGTPAERFPELAADVGADVRADVRRIMPVIDRACAPIAADRFASAEQFSAALDALSPGRRRRGGRRAALIVILLATGGVLWRGARRDAPPPAPAELSGATGHAQAAGLRAAGANDDGSQTAPAEAGLHGALELRYCPDAESPGLTLGPQLLPLRTGGRVQVRVALNRPGYPLVALLTRDGGAQVVYPVGDRPQQAVQSLVLPDGKYYPLKPPEETLTFVLLADDKPFAAPAEIAQRLSRLGPLPDVGPDSMLLLAEGRLDSLRAGGATRGVDLEHPVAARPGLLERLHDALHAEIPVVYAVAVPQATAAAATEQPATGRADAGNP